MSVASESSTSMTLLDRVCRLPPDEDAWDEFVQRYSPCVYDWCRSFGLQGADADDVVQSVLEKLLRVMNKFACDPSRSFRGWLWKVTRSARSDFCENKKAIMGQGAGDSAILKLLGSVAAGDDLQERMMKAHQQAILEEAKKRVQLQVQEHTWQAFELTAIEGLPAGETARQLDMPVAEVYVAKCRVLKRLKDMARILSGPDNE